MGSRLSSPGPQQRRFKAYIEGLANAAGALTATTWPLAAADLRWIARSAGVHLYGGDGDVLYAGRHCWLFAGTSQAGATVGGNRAVAFGPISGTSVGLPPYPLM